MKVRGQRECRDCGRQWSYYETGSVACPHCESLRSVGVDERARHTAGPATFDLSAHRRTVDGGSIADVVEDAKRDARAYVRERGFIDGGELLPLDDAYLAAGELVHALDCYARTRAPDDDEEYYVLSLLTGADHGERPGPDDVPASMHAGRGLAYADAVDDYRREVTIWLDDRDREEPAARRVLSTLTARAKRVRALQGDVEPREAEALVRAAREITAYLTADDEAALVTAEDRLQRLD